MVWKKAMMYAKKEWKRDEDFDMWTNSRFNDDYGLYYKDPLQVFGLMQHLSLKFPRHFIFGNFQCLRCGECCHWDSRHIYRNDIKRWILESRYDILSHVSCPRWSKVKFVSCASRFLHYAEQDPCENCHGGDIHPVNEGKCPFVRKVKNEPYYKCRIHDTVPEECSEWLCRKSLSISQLNWNNMEELIQKIGIERYTLLIKGK
jgi:Fe-S-cluster containining protein